MILTTILYMLMFDSENYACKKIELKIKMPLANIKFAFYFYIFLFSLCINLLHLYMQCMHGIYKYRAA
jgi:multisubunit Na+/H+ antiporter MnhB subunit